MVPLEVEQEPRSIACFFFFILTTPKHILHILRCDELVTNKFYTHPTGNEMWWGLRVQFSSLFSSLHASLPVLFSACFTWLDEWNTRLMPPRFEPLTSRDYTGALSHRATVPCLTIIFLLFFLFQSIHTCWCCTGVMKVLCTSCALLIREGISYPTSRCRNVNVSFQRSYPTTVGLCSWWIPHMGGIRWYVNHQEI